MQEDGLEAVLSFIEKAGIRLKVNEVLVECLEKGNTTSFQDLVEELILAGPDSIRIVREILSEVDLMLYQFQEKFDESYKGTGDKKYQFTQLPEKLQHHIFLMKEIHAYLNDWLWGLIYLSTRNEGSQNYTLANKTSWLL